MTCAETSGVIERLLHHLQIPSTCTEAGTVTRTSQTCGPITCRLDSGPASQRTQRTR